MLAVYSRVLASRPLHLFLENYPPVLIDSEAGQQRELQDVGTRESSISVDIVKQDLSRESTCSGPLLMTFKEITVYLCSVFGLVVTEWNRGYPVLCSVFLPRALKYLPKNAQVQMSSKSFLIS